MKSKPVLYWVTTVILALGVVSGGISQAAHNQDTIAGIMALGYPLYFITVLGVWKVFGGLAILIPRFPRVKEWAYAGIFFEMTGAALSHAVCGDLGASAFHLIAPLLFAILAIVSWALRPESRTLGVLFPAKVAG